jgi:hypothetical protein
MHAAKRPYVLAAAALAATSLVAVTPTTSQVALQAGKLPVRSYDTQLVDAGESLLNVPINLFDDLINIPANELYATQFFTDNLFMAGPWFVVGPTNLWGVDPGDPTHYQSVINFLIPFTGLSGMDAPETDFTGGLGQQVWGLVASELPTNASCDEAACIPFEPASPVTGISSVDFFEWLGATLSGQEQNGLFDNWFDADYSSNGSYYFNPDNPGSVDPTATSPGGEGLLPAGTEVATGYVNPFEGWSGISTAGQVDGTGSLLGGEGIPGTAGAAPDDAGYYMPWSGDTYQFEPQVPIDNFFNSLMETPSTSGLDGTGIDPIYGDPTEILQTFQSFAAGLLMFDPFTPGSPFCPGECTAITADGLNYPSLITDINNLTPGGNPVINEWLADYTGTTVNGVAPDPDGGANVPSEATIQQSIDLLQSNNYWDFGNPPYTGENTPGNPDLGAIYPEFQQFWNELGFNTTNAPYDPTTSIEALENAFSSTQLTADFAALGTAFDPTQLAADYAALLAGIGL